MSNLETHAGLATFLEGTRPSTETFPLEAVLRASRHAPTNKAFMQSVLEKTAAANGLEVNDLTAVTDMVSTVVGYFRAGGSLDDLSVTYADKDDLFTTSAEMVTSLNGLKVAQVKILLRQRQLQAQGWEILTAELNTRGNSSPSAKQYEDILQENRYSCFAGGIKSADRARRLLKQLHAMREAHTTVLYLFRNSALNFRFSGGPARHAKVTGCLVGLFGKYLENLQYYPFARKSDDLSPMSALRTNFYKNAEYPGAENASFAVCGTHWRFFNEAREYFQKHGSMEASMSMDDEDILETDQYQSHKVFTHLLFTVKVDGQDQLAVAAPVAAGTILGLLPNEHRYAHPPEAHWFHLPNDLYFEPLPSIFSPMFCNSDKNLGNVVLGYDVIRDRMTGMSPSYKIFVVADRAIAPLEPLRI